jgi:hypothetical protein
MYETIETQLVGRLAIGKKRYGHGVIVNSDTREWGTPENSWINMCQEELLDAVIYIIADYIREGRRSDKMMCDLEIDYKIDEKFSKCPDPIKYLLEIKDEDENSLIMHIVKNYTKIESPKHKMLVWNLLNMLLVCSQF